MLVGQVMARNVITVTPHTSHRDALELMRQHKIRRLPVLDGSRLVGIVSEKDLLTTAPSPATTLSIYEIYTLLDKLTLNKIMTHPVVTIGPDCPIQDAARIMTERKIGCLPIMRGDDLVGIVTETDIMKVLVSMLGGGEPGFHFTVRIKDEPGTLAHVADAVAKAGGNIISVSSFRPTDGNLGEVVIKESGADEQKLRHAVREAGAELISMQDGKPHEPKLFG